MTPFRNGAIIYMHRSILCVYLYIRMCIYIYIHMYIYIYTCMCVCMYVCMNECMHVYTHMFVYVLIYLAGSCDLYKGLLRIGECVVAVSQVA